MRKGRLTEDAAAGAARNDVRRACVRRTAVVAGMVLETLVYKVLVLVDVVDERDGGRWSIGDASWGRLACGECRAGAFQLARGGSSSQRDP